MKTGADYISEYCFSIDDAVDTQRAVDAVDAAITDMKQLLNKHGVIRWVDTNIQMPDYDGMYLAFIHQKQVCGTVLKIQRVVENRMNAWVLDESDEVKFWAKLPPPPVV